MMLYKGNYVICNKVRELATCVLAVTAPDKSLSMVCANIDYLK